MRSLFRIILLLAAAAPAITQPSPYGFKGIQLGQSGAELSELIKSSPWAHSVEFSSYDPAADPEAKYVSLTSEELTIRLSEIEFDPDAFSKVACGVFQSHDYCIHFGDVSVRKLEGRVAEIAIDMNGQWLPLGVRMAGDALVGAIREKFGPPTSVRTTFARLRDAEIPRIAEKREPVVSWRSRNGDIDQSIEILLQLWSRREKQKRYVFHVKIRDDSAFAAEERRKKGVGRQSGF